MAEAVPFVGTAQPDIYCPGNPAVVCPSRAEVAKFYMSDVSMAGTSELSLEASPITDRAKMAVKLRENQLAATAINCEGTIEEGLCPTRAKMNESEVRTTVLSGLRRIFNRSKEEQ